MLPPSVQSLLAPAGVPLQDGREFDLEGGATFALGDRSVGVWIGSHGNRKSDWEWGEGAWRVREARPELNRRLLFATTLPGTEEPQSLVGAPITDLVQAARDPRRSRG